MVVFTVLLLVLLLVLILHRQVPQLEHTPYMYGQIPELAAPLPKKRFNVIIVSGTSNRAKRQWVDPAVRLQTQYAATHGADYWFVDLDKYPYPHLGLRSPHWNKLAIVSKVLPHYEYVMWIDDDAAPVPNSGKDFRTLIRHAGDVDYIGFRDMKPVDRVNTGIFILRNSPWSQRFLSSVWHSAHLYYPGHSGGEQRAMNELGFIPDCPRLSRIHTRLTAAKRQVDRGEPIRGKHICIYNENAGNSPHSSFIVHLAGKSNKARMGIFNTLSPATPGLKTAYPWSTHDRMVNLRDHHPIMVSPLTAAANNVPRRIYQSFDVADVPPRIAESSDSWRRLNPGFEYRFFDAHARIAFIKKHFSPVIYNAFRLVRAGALQADLFKYCVLYHHGGVYVDVGCVATESLPQDWPDFVAVKDRQSNKVLTSFIYTAPKHPILRASIDICVTRVTDMVGGIKSKSPRDDVLGQAISQVETKRGVYLLERSGYEVNNINSVFMKTPTKNSDIQRLTGKNQASKMIHNGTAVDTPLYSVGFFVNEKAFMESNMVTGIITITPPSVDVATDLLQLAARFRMGQSPPLPPSVQILMK